MLLFVVVVVVVIIFVVVVVISAAIVVVFRGRSLHPMSWPGMCLFFMGRRRITNAQGGFESYSLLAFVIVAEEASMVDVTRFFRVYMIHYLMLNHVNF